MGAAVATGATWTALKPGANEAKDHGMAGESSGGAEGADDQTGGDDQSTDTGTGGDTGGTDTGGQGETTGTVPTIDDAAAKAIKRTATGQAKRKLLEDAGVESAEELNALVAEAKASRAQNQTEAERDREAAAQERQELARERAELRSQRLQLSLAGALGAKVGDGDGEGPVRDDRRDDAVGFLLGDLLTLEDGEDEAEAVKAAAAEARTRWPEWFGAGGEGAQQQRTPETPRRRHTERTPAGTDDPRERARVKFAAMRGGSKS